MAVTLLQVAQWLYHENRSNFNELFGAAITRVAVEVMQEPAGTENHAARVVLARSILADPSQVRDKNEMWRAAMSNDDTIVGVTQPSEAVALAAIRRAFAILA